ncbi:ImmA/IrrE family metallo-endopeptidase [Leisingera sp. XS_AS12]|uniref:ImmA/IrrE family metallo-endopeptidase n=1 Tax=Leisingera sp. XS_AS12 TaxID=3241294 RepID=UPI003514A8C0
MTSATEYLRPIETGMARSEIEALAERIRIETGVQTGYDLDELISTRSGRVRRIDFEDHWPHALRVEPDGSFEVCFSTHRPARCSNTTMAVEFGHIVLHWQRVRDLHPGTGMRIPVRIDGADEELIRSRQEARFFADAFLMPAALAREVFQKGGANAVADTFGVTIMRAEVRMTRLLKYAS